LAAASHEADTPGSLSQRARTVCAGALDMGGGVVLDRVPRGTFGHAFERGACVDQSRNLVSSPWLAEHVVDPDADVVIIDCRFDLANPRAGGEAYSRAHIPGAVYLDLERDLSGPKGPHGGRHPLPEISRFVEKIGSVGIDEHVTVVAYDAQNGCFAARLWWMLRYAGHERVRVLDGGWQAWQHGGYSTTADIPTTVARRFVPTIRSEVLVDLDELHRRRGRPETRLVDSRTGDRYRGDVEPIDPVAGHIPGALNLAWTDNQDTSGAMKPVEDLRRRFADVRAEGPELVVYCGSGVTACVNLLAMEEAGITDAVLYLGGWSDWCSYPDNPVAKGD
jgi:thiosulfate/3-mercaptopyruvate sulfurtransferase